MYTYTYPIQPTNTTQHTSLNTSSVLARENRTELCFRSDHEKNSFLLLLPPSFSSQPTNHLSSLLSISPKKKKQEFDPSWLAAGGHSHPLPSVRTKNSTQIHQSEREGIHSILFYSILFVSNELIHTCLYIWLSILSWKYLICKL